VNIVLELKALHKPDQYEKSMLEKFSYDPNKYMLSEYQYGSTSIISLKEEAPEPEKEENNLEKNEMLDSIPNRLSTSMKFSRSKTYCLENNVNKKPITKTVNGGMSNKSIDYFGSREFSNSCINFTNMNKIDKTGLAFSHNQSFSPRNEFQLVTEKQLEDKSSIQMEPENLSDSAVGCGRILSTRLRRSAAIRKETKATIMLALVICKDFHSIIFHFTILEWKI